MEALQFTLKQKKLELVKKPIPKIENPHQILVKVAYSGICGTDLHILAVSLRIFTIFRQL